MEIWDEILWCYSRLFMYLVTLDLILLISSLVNSWQEEKQQDYVHVCLAKCSVEYELVCFTYRGQTPNCWTLPVLREHAHIDWHTKVTWEVTAQPVSMARVTSIWAARYILTKQKNEGHIVSTLFIILKAVERAVRTVSAQLFNRQDGSLQQKPRYCHRLLTFDTVWGY